MEQQKPQIPTLKDSQKPQVKIKGLQAGLSLFDRLKQFKKKDLAFITAGLGVLFMAPLAEHFMMTPENGNGAFNPGWDFKNANALGANASPYESGINGLAPGGVTGGGDIITPLNVRDPSALVMGPGAQQQAPATNVAPPPPAPSKSESDGWKDAIANAASRGASEATKRAALPVPKPSLTNAGLRGLGAVSGGGGGSFSGGPISSQGLTSNRASGADGGVNRIASAPGFRGVAGPRGSNNASAGSMEALKKAAGGAQDQMNRSGPGSSALEQAASMGMNNGGGSFGRGAGGEGGPDKGFGGNQDKNSMNVGESLAFMRMKQEQEKAIDLKWKQIEMETMMWPELKKKMLEELAMAPVKGLAAGVTDMFKDWGSNKSNANWVCKGAKVAKSKVGKCYSTGKDQPYGLFYNESDRSIYSDPQCKPPAAYTDCKPEDDPTSTNNAKDAVSGVAPVGDSEAGSGAMSLDEVCTKLKGEGTSETSGGITADMLKAARQTTEVRNSISGGHKDNACGPRNLVTSKSGTSVQDIHQKLIKTLAGSEPTSLVSTMRSITNGANLSEVNAEYAWNQEKDKIKGHIKEKPDYTQSAAADATDALVLKVKVIDAELQKAIDAEAKIDEAAKQPDAAGAGGSAGGPLSQAKAQLADANGLIEKLNGRGQQAEQKAGLPGPEFGNAAMDTAVKGLQQRSAETDKIYESLKSIVAFQRSALEQAGKVQETLKGHVEKAEKEYRLAMPKVVNNGKWYRGLSSAKATAADPLTKDPPPADAISFGERKKVANNVGFKTLVPMPTANDLVVLGKKKPRNETEETTYQAAVKQITLGNDSHDADVKGLASGRSYLGTQVETVNEKIVTYESNVNAVTSKLNYAK